ncbi:MAG: hypothetical protein QXS68_07725 [Candidatus Methanomethylicaceae archaeon]
MNSWEKLSHLHTCSRLASASVAVVETLRPVLEWLDSPLHGFYLRTGVTGLLIFGERLIRL